MWSGTAVKAVIVYISDYITKTGLKTHVVFETIKSIFDRHSEILNDNIPDEEKSRHIMCRIANLLSTKSELGGPMISLYLLGLPDHYTSHTFVTLNWRVFVNEVLTAWTTSDIDIEIPKVTLYKNNDNLIPISPVYDYIYWPVELTSINLYQWACQYSKICLTKKQKKKDEYNSDNDNNEMTKKTMPKKSLWLLQQHPSYDTHACIQTSHHNKNIVNFIGGVLPRCDHGDREFFCCTMLTLFKPWRSGQDLKTDTQTWDEAFNTYNFTAHEEQIMKNFNIRYECLDAWDDYHAQLKAGQAQPLFNSWDTSDDTFDRELNTYNEEHMMDIQIDGPGADETMSQPLSNYDLKLQKEAAQIRAVLDYTGWSRVPFLSNEPNKISPFIPQTEHTASQWKSVIQTEKNVQIAKQMGSLSPSKTLNVKNKINPLDQVKIVGKEYLQKKYYTKEALDMTKTICSNFDLNADQERAFNLITQHVLINGSEPLKLYIGGMGGTGKSRVIHALSNFFSQCGEAYRFMTIAPTGSAAALLAGSTYHSVLGINEFNKEISDKTVSKARNRLLRVDYFFFHEISMLSCHELYKISARLARIFNCHDVPFGGVNMIFTGDFGQLPPPVGEELVALYSRTIGKNATKVKSQEEAIGRAVWHQVTSVVILRENMRQKHASPDDDKLRTALANMRYKDCTKEDIKFLKSKITSTNPGCPSICDQNFALVSIITAQNNQKDEINKLGCIKFAKMTGQLLSHFFSEDRPCKPRKNQDNDSNKGGKCISSISQVLQNELWNLPHSAANKHIPGMLSLCIGMPIMIKHNEATELCITNGQEATVIGQQSCLGKWKQQVLETLFVKLTNPPTTIQLQNLPQNVVPLTKTERRITCNLKHGKHITISRSQVEILPNFAMTDYASQGKTREYNVVDLSKCHSHQAYYVALSRSASANNTIILQDFEVEKITGGASGALRQEFRELELLDEITKLCYNDKFPPDVQGETRYSLIESYRQHKGSTYLPSSLHPSLMWTHSDPMPNQQYTSAIKIKQKAISTFQQMGQPQKREKLIHITMNKNPRNKDLTIIPQ